MESDATMIAVKSLHREVLDYARGMVEADDVATRGVRMQQWEAQGHA